MHTRQDVEASEEQYGKLCHVPGASHAGQHGVGSTASQCNVQQQERDANASHGHEQQQQTGADASQGHAQQREHVATVSEGHATHQANGCVVSPCHVQQQDNGASPSQDHAQQQGHSTPASHVQQQGTSSTASGGHAKQHASGGSVRQGHTQQQQDGSSHDTRDRVLEMMRAGMWAECMALLQRLRSEVHGRQLNTAGASLRGTVYVPTQQQQHAESPPVKHRQQQQGQQGQGQCAAAQLQGQQLGTTTGYGGLPGKPCSLDMWVHGREATQAWVIAGLHVHAAAREWAQALQLKPHLTGAAGVGGGRGQGDAVKTWTVAKDRLPQQALDEQAAAVRRAHRRVAALVHPDKCSLPHAEQAFQLASLARTRLLDGLGITSGLSGMQGEGEGEGDGEEGYNWWDPWDVPQQQASAWAAAEFAAAQAVAAAADEEQALWHMPVQELRGVVQQQQSCLLLRSQPGQPDIHTKQRLLRRARSVLAQRLAGQEAPDSAANISHTDQLGDVRTQHSRISAPTFSVAHVQATRQLAADGAPLPTLQESMYSRKRPLNSTSVSGCDDIT